jgi:hypothetical protein
MWAQVLSAPGRRSHARTAQVPLPLPLPLLFTSCAEQSFKMKRVLSQDGEEASKMRKSIVSLIDIEREREEVVRRFASARATSWSINEEELQEVHLMLQMRGLLQNFEPRLATVMPEFYCIFKELEKKAPIVKDYSKKLERIIVSRGMMARPNVHFR